MTVYLALSPELFRVKIGCAAAPHERLRSLQTGSPTQLLLLAVCDGKQEVEKALHERFAKEHLHGEWFNFSVDIAKFALFECSHRKCDQKALALAFARIELDSPGVIAIVGAAMRARGLLD